MAALTPLWGTRVSILPLPWGKGIYPDEADLKPDRHPDDLTAKVCLISSYHAESLNRLFNLFWKIACSFCSVFKNVSKHHKYSPYLSHVLVEINVFSILQIWLAPVLQCVRVMQGKILCKYLFIVFDIPLCCGCMAASKQHTTGIINTNPYN